MFPKPFQFLGYDFNTASRTATFRYRGKTNYTETVQFPHIAKGYNADLLDRALFLSFILIGTSYYKSHPTRKVKLSLPIDDFQADFFTKVYQEGLSQFAFENHLSRKNLATFSGTKNYSPAPPVHHDGQGILALQSGGKDSLLTATLLNKHRQSYTPWFVSNDDSATHPQILEELPGAEPLEIAIRKIDHAAFKKAPGLNGHVPVTYIIMSLALCQAILNNQNTVVTSVAWEGNEPHAKIGDLEVNHQWSKSWPAEQAFAEYVSKYISPDLHIGSPLRQYSELYVAKLFTENCWEQFAHSFSSCNQANYKQGKLKAKLSWCGECAKCANSYLLFCPFLPAAEQNQLFAGQDLFSKASLTDIYKGLLGVDNFIKPFECVGTTAELQRAYHLRQPDYSALPFPVPDSNFDYLATYPSQPFFQELFS